MNVLCLTGRLAKDNQSKRINVKGGTDTMMVLENSIAYSHWNPSKKEDETHFLKIKLKGSQAEFVSKYFNKGDGIVLTGALLSEKWEKEGQTHYGYYLAVEKAEFGQKKKEDGQGQSYRQAPDNAVPAQQSQLSDTSFEENDDELPF